MKQTIARVISEHLEEHGDRYDLANSASIKVLAIDLQGILAAAGYEAAGMNNEPLWHADDCGGTCDGCGHIASDGFWYNAPCPDDLLRHQLEWAESGAPKHEGWDEPHFNATGCDGSGHQTGWCLDVALKEAQ